MSMSANVAIPTPPVPIAENQNPEMSPSLEIACDKGVCVWKKTTSKTIKRANGFIASSRVLHGAGLDSKSPEEREDENNEMKEEETQKTIPKEISLPAPPPGDISDDEPEYAPRKNEIDTLDSDDLLEIDDDYDNGGMLCDGDLCDVAPSEMHSPTPLVFHYRGSQRDRGKKDGPIDISEIFVKTVSILKDSEEDSHSLVSVLDSQRVKLTNERNSGKELGQQLIQICIPEHKLVKMVVFSPLQTISSFVDTLLGSIAKSEQPDDYQMVFPIFLDGSISAFSLDSNAVFGIYGIGMNEDEVPPTLFLFHKTTDNVYDIPKYESFLGTKVSSKEDAKIDAWVKILTSWNAFPPGSVAHATIQKTISKMAVAGIPPAIRGWAWRQISGSSTLANEHPSLYADLLAKALKTPPSYMRKINVDLPRSLPRHPFFAKEESFGQPALKRVLLAFGQYEEAIGYCQGVNFLAATLLCFMDEEIMDKYHMKNFYTDGIKLLRSTVAAFRTLFAEDIPDLAKFLEDRMIPIDVFAPSWFQSIFSGVDLNFNITVRIWDMFFCEGQQFLYKVSLAFLAILKDTLLQSGIEKAMKILQLRKGCLDLQIDPLELIENATKIKTRPSMDPTNEEYH